MLQTVLHTMNFIINLPECVICTDVLDDPRQLLCGHSYCGPHKTCLSALAKINANLKCAVCGLVNKQRIEDLKPMYGIREFLEQQKSILEKTSLPDKEEVCKTLICKAHVENEAKFWCTNCEELICSDCIISDKHFSHQFGVFGANKRSIVAKKLKQLNNSKSNYEQKLELGISQLELKRKSLHSLAEHERKLILEKKTVQKNWSALNNFVDKTSDTLPNEALNWLFDFENLTSCELGFQFFCDRATEIDKLAKSSKQTQTKIETTDFEAQITDAQNAAQTETMEHNETVAIKESTIMPVVYVPMYEDTSLTVVVEDIEIFFPYDENDSKEMTSSLITNQFCCFTLSLKPSKGKIDPMVVTLKVLEHKRESKFSLGIVRNNGKMWRVFEHKRVSAGIHQKASSMSKNQQRRYFNEHPVINASIEFF